MIPDTPSDADEQADKDAVFVEQYRLTGDAVQACIRAGIRDPRYPITVIAARTLQRPEIAGALAALKRIETSALPLEVTRESVVADMEEVFQRALSDGQYASAVGAKKLQGMLLGLLDQKLIISHSLKVELMSDDQLMRIASGSMRDVTAAGREIIDVEDD